MRTTFPILVALLVSGSLVGLVGCSSDGSSGDGAPPASTINASPQPAPTGTGTSAVTDPPKDDPGPKPAGCGDLKADKDGFFTRKTSEGSYVGHVPASYKGDPTTLVVGIHGCGDTALNFGKWAVNPYATIDAQSHIGISIGGRDGECWDTKKDAPKVTAAIADVKTCLYVHQKKVVLAGYSSGGILAYQMGLGDAGKYAGIIIENSGLAGADPAKASWKINVAHIAHTSDDSFPIAEAHSDWAKLEAAGIPLQKKEVAGTHDGTSDDWSDYLVPKISGWIAP